MLHLVVKGLLRRPVRTSLTIAGVALAVAVLALIDELGAAYSRELSAELNRTGIHLMLVPLGCPYDAAANVLKGNALENSLPESAVRAALVDPAVEIAAPLLIATLPRPDQGRTDLFVGLNEAGIALKPWWHAEHGGAQFDSADEVILGADAAVVEMRAPGEMLNSPETKTRFKVAGVLQRSGTSDDSRFFIPLETAQRIFHSEGRVTAVAIRLKDAASLRAASERLRDVPGAQVVTATEMMGTFLRILGTVRTLLHSIALVALVASVLGLANALLMSVAERSFEFSLFRALGASRLQIFLLITFEALALTVAGLLLGLLFSAFIAPGAGSALSRIFDLPLVHGITAVRPAAAVNALICGAAGAILVSIFPAWRAAASAPGAALKAE